MRSDEQSDRLVSYSAVDFRTRLMLSFRLLITADWSCSTAILEPMSHYEELLRAFRIGAEDIEANRLGRLGTTQQRHMLSSGNWNMAGAFFIGCLLSAILYGVATKPLVPIQWTLCILLFASVLIVSIRYFRQTRIAVAEDRVECLIGQIQLSSRGYAGWYLTVAGQSFRLPIRPWQIQRNTVYCVYIVPRTQSLVAMDVASDRDFSKSSVG